MVICPIIFPLQMCILSVNQGQQYAQSHKAHKQRGKREAHVIPKPLLFPLQIATFNFLLDIYFQIILFSPLNLRWLKEHLSKQHSQNIYDGNKNKIFLRKEDDHAWHLL